MVDVTKPIVNPRLSEALAALHRENTPANQDRVLRELMTQAPLRAPVVLTPPPPPAGSRLGGAAEAVRPPGPADPGPHLR